MGRGGLHAAWEEEGAARGSPACHTGHPLGPHTMSRWVAVGVGRSVGPIQSHPTPLASGTDPWT